jgi:hypothetical protein
MNLCVFWICLPKLPHACVRRCSRISKLGLVQSPDTLLSRLGYWIISIHGNKESPLVSRDGSPRGEMRVDGGVHAIRPPFPFVAWAPSGRAPSDWPRNLTPLSATWTTVGPTSINIPPLLACPVSVTSQSPPDGVGLNSNRFPLPKT